MVSPLCFSTGVLFVEISMTRHTYYEISWRRLDKASSVANLNLEIYSS